MSTAKSVAILGAGRVGTPIAKALLAKGVDVRILSRTSDAKPGLEQAKIVPVDYQSKDSIKAALSGVDVVISTLSTTPDFLQSQKNVADVGKEIGLKLFVTSDFGVDLRKIPAESIASTLQVKVQVAEYTASIGLPTLRFFTGLFAEFLFTPFLGWDAQKKTMSIVGNDQQPIGSTSLRDVGGFVAHVLTTQPLDQLAGQELSPQSFRGTWRDYIKTFEEVKGTGPLDVTVVPVDEAYKTLATLDNPGAQFVYWLKIAFAHGWGDTASDNAKVGYQPIVSSPKDVIL